ncbi:MAG: FAD binding domain-containing protein, partial [Candidatus Bathyarchaeia archaeon]
MNIEFQIFFPKTLNDAYRLLDQYGENAKIIAGGQSLTPMINLGLIAPTYLIDLSRIPGLTEIKEDNGGGLSVGSLATHAAVASSSLVKQKCMLLSQTASQIGDVQIRSRGTIGGSVCHADPAADYPAAAVALNATMELSNQKGTRVVPAAEFFQGMYETALQPNDVLTRVIVPASPVKSGSAYMRLCYVHGAFPIVSVAAV